MRSFLNREIFIDSLRVRQIPLFNLEYAPDNLGRELRS